MKKYVNYILGIIAALLIPISTFAYTVQKGDTLWAISKKLGTTVQNLVNSNGITNKNLIYQGQQLNVSELLGAAPLPTDNYDTFLTAALSATASTTFVNALPTGVSSSIYTIFGSDGVTPSEKIYCTGTATGPNRLTGCIRGISFNPVNGVINENAGTGITQPRNSRIAITDNINFSGKALAILNGSQVTGANTFRMGDGTSVTDKCHIFDDGTQTAKICKNVSTGNLYWTTDGINTYTFQSSTVSQLSASTSAGIGITNSQIYITPSSTTGMTFDSSGKIYQKIDTTTAVQYSAGSVGIGINTSTLVSLIATSTPSAGTIPLSTTSSILSPGWLNATSTPTANKLSIGDSNGTLNSWITTSNKIALITSTVDINNPGTTLTNLISTTIPANTLGTGNAVRVVMYFSNFQINNTFSLFFSASYGGTTIATTTLTNNSGNSNATVGRAEFTLYENGTTSSQSGSLYASGMTQNFISVAGASGNLFALENSGTGAVNDTVDQTLKVSVEFSSASGNNHITMDSATIERVY